MREIIARLVCGVTVCVVLTLSWLFASRHNPPSTLQASDENSRVVLAGGLDPDAERGRAVYAAHNCASCHAVAGRGNPRHPLDGVGSRRNAEELSQYVTGTGIAADTLSDAVVRRKATYREMPADEMTALISYLSRLPAVK